MRWEQLDLATGCWTIPSSHHKNKRIHTVPLPPAAIEIIRRRIGVSPEWVFPSSVSKTGHMESVRGPWKQALKALAAELSMDSAPDLRIHDLRHTTASWLVAQGVSLPMVGRVLGHASTQTTARYAHLATDPVREVLNQAAAAMSKIVNPNK
ncbi:site-specific tyrosine recombinase XerC [compost metagenome]